MEPRHFFLVNKCLLASSSGLLLCPYSWLPGASFLNYEHMTQPFSLWMCYSHSKSSRQMLDCQSTLPACSDSWAHSFVIFWVFIVPCGSQNESSSLILFCCPSLRCAAILSLGRLSSRSIFFLVVSFHLLKGLQFGSWCYSYFGRHKPFFISFFCLPSFLPLPQFCPGRHNTWGCRVIGDTCGFFLCIVENYLSLSTDSGAKWNLRTPSVNCRSTS